MSMTTEQIKWLRELSDKTDDSEINKALCTSANTIEILSAKLHRANMERSSAHYHGGWIPCDEGLPDETGDYLVTIYWNERIMIDIGEIDCDGIFKKWNYKSEVKVLAWMPLPEPYKEVDK